MVPLVNRVPVHKLEQALLLLFQHFLNFTNKTEKNSLSAESVPVLLQSSVHLLQGLSLVLRF